MEKHPQHKRKTSIDEQAEIISVRPKFTDSYHHPIVKNASAKRTGSAKKVSRISTPKARWDDDRDGIWSAKASTGHLKSSLDPEFLNLFDNRL
jgi:hypothetical protein